MSCMWKVDKSTAFSAAGAYHALVDAGDPHGVSPVFECMFAEERSRPFPAYEKLLWLLDDEPNRPGYLIFQFHMLTEWV